MLKVLIAAIWLDIVEVATFGVPLLHHRHFDLGFLDLGPFNCREELMLLDPMDL